MPSSVESSPARRNPPAITTTASVAGAGAMSRQQFLTPIPLIFDSLTFDARQEKWIKDLERKVSIN